MIEGGLTVLAITIAFAFPSLGECRLSSVERAFQAIAKNRSLSVALIGLLAISLRLAILPLCPIPHPFTANDFSFLLAADTFAHDRLTNPTPAMWTHFETVHVMMKPTYMSMYFPGPGLVLAAGQVLTGHPWFGLLFVTALMCAAICWALQAWLPPTWALLGGFIAVLRLGLFSYWINTYTGGGSVAALGGALVIGAFPRLMHGARLRHGILLAIGIIILAISRPYEGMLLCLPVLFVLIRWIYKGKNRPPAAVLARGAALPLLLVLTGIAWLGYYNYRVNGSPTTLPYKIDRQTYARAPYFIWQSELPAHVYRHKQMQRFYSVDELVSYQLIHNLHGYLPRTLIKVWEAIIFYAGIALLPLLIMLPMAFRDHRMRFLVACAIVLIVGSAIEVFFVPEYPSPFLAALYALALQAARHMRLWRPGGQPIGKMLIRLLVLTCIVMFGFRLFANPLHISFSESQTTDWIYEWYGPGQFGAPRARVEAWLEHQPGKQLAIVRYAPDHDPASEWVYNAADINSSKVIWAWDMGPAQNAQLIHFYKGRTVWLVQPDKNPPLVTPYPLPTRLPVSPATSPAAAQASTP